MPSVSDAALSRYQRRLLLYRTLTSAGLGTLWDDLDSYTDEDLERFQVQAEPLLAGVKAATVATSAAFFALALGLSPAGVKAADVAVEPRITHPFLSTWHALKEGRPFEEAVAAGRSQAEAVGFDFVQSTSRRTGDYVAKASGRKVRWQRVPGGDACSWCHTVAGQTYYSAESADFGHDRCDCSVVPAD